MNRKEREILDIHTGKIKFSEEEIAKQEALKKKKKIETRNKILIVSASVLILALIITGIVSFYQWRGRIAEENKNNPPKVTKPNREEMKKIENELVVFETSMGNFKLELYPEAAPLTVNNFRRLVAEKFFDGTIFHRVINDFMIQGGGYDEKSVSKDPGYKFKDEINAKSLGLDETTIKSYTEEGYKYDAKLKSIKLDYGVLAMANAGPNTNSSEFFIISKKDGVNYQDATPWLIGRHTGFGRVVQGMEVVEKIQKVKTYKNKEDEKDTKNDKPLQDVIVKKVYIEQKAKK